jgi:hypothetical protein
VDATGGYQATQTITKCRPTILRAFATNSRLIMLLNRETGEDGVSRLRPGDWETAALPSRPGDEHLKQLEVISTPACAPNVTATLLRARQNARTIVNAGLSDFNHYVIIITRKFLYVMRFRLCSGWVCPASLNSTFKRNLHSGRMVQPFNNCLTVTVVWRRSCL